MRLMPAALAATLALMTPALAQVCVCGPDLGTEADPATVLVPYVLDAPRPRQARRSVSARRVVSVRRTLLVPGRIAVPVVVGPVPGAGYPGHWHYGATYVPPGAAYGCTLGTVGCDSSSVAPLGLFGGE